MEPNRIDAPSARSVAGGRAVVLAAAATLALCLLALSSQSLWTDELGTWRLTVAAGWADWFRQLVNWPNSDAQIPFYHLYMRLWVQVFPATELALRAANLPWLFLGFLALLTTPVPPDGRRRVLLLAAVLFLHPMVWYYANEARPYAMILAGACVAASGMLARLSLAPGSASPAGDARLIVGTAIMAGTSVIGVIWSVAFLLPVAGLLWHENPRALRDALRLTPGNRLLALVCALILLPIGYQYAWSFLHGVSATAFHENSLQNFGFGLYEITGFGGVGPGREELRVVGAAGLVHSAGPLLLYALAVGAVLALGLRDALRRNRRATLLLLLAALLPLVVLFVLGTLKHWRVVGRHMMPLVLFFALFLACGLDALLRPAVDGLRRRARLALAAAALAALAVSSVLIAHAPRHSREDFRGAARMATQYLGGHQRVWWVAQSFGADYYHLPIVDPTQCATAGDRAAVLLESPRDEQIAGCPEPQFIFIGRYDTEGAVGRYADAHRFAKVASLPGFEILGK